MGKPDDCGLAFVRSFQDSNLALGVYPPWRALSHDLARLTAEWESVTATASAP